MTPEEFAQLERVSRQVLWMYDLTDRERRVAQVIIDHSFARGRAAVVISSLQAFVDMTGLHPGDVSETLKLMRAKGIVQRRGPRDARSYEFLPAAKYWQESKALYSVERAIARSVEIERENGQGKLPVEEADLEDGMAMASRDEAVRDGQALLSAERTGDDVISDSLISRAVEPGSGGSQISKSLISPAQISDSLISKSLTSKSCARTRAGDVLQKRNVSTRIAIRSEGSPEQQKRFRDEEKNHLFARIEEACGKTERDRADFEQNRFTWLRRIVDDFPIVRRQFDQVMEREQKPGNKREKTLLAVLYRGCVKQAQAVNRVFRMFC